MPPPKAKLKNVLKEPVMRGKPTIATILREHKLVESRDAIERQELETLMSGGMSPENYHYWMEKRKEEDERLGEQCKVQIKLDAKMTKERILEKNKERVEENRLRALKFKEEEGKMKQDIAAQNEEELCHARERVDQIILDQLKSQMAVHSKQKEKEHVAQIVKNETSKIIEKVKNEKKKEDLQKKEVIKKIQAASLVQCRIRQMYNPYEIKEHGCEMSDSEAQFRIYLHKCEESSRVLETRNRVREEKMAKKKKLEEAAKKIAAYHDMVKARRKF